jgi:predicted dithiol-disulfide oxidoreductase (DUF899 family)
MAVRPLANESPEYRKLRAELLEAERALRDQIERVAALRRALPAGTVVEDAVFEEVREGVRVPVRLSELFERPDQTLVLMHFMYGKKQAKPCPMCRRNLRSVGAAGSDLKQRLGFEQPDGAQWPGASVFRKHADGTLVHTYSVNADFGPGQLRGMDLLSPFWSFLDLTPEGRGDFMPKRSY